MHLENQVLSSRRTWLSALRWLAVLPGALLGILAASVLIRVAVVLIHYFGNADEGPPRSSLVGFLALIPLETFEYFCDSLLFPVAAIIVAARIAPTWKFPVGIGIGILWGLFWGAAIAFMATRNRLDWSAARTSITLLLGLAGTVIGLVEVYKKHSTGFSGDEPESGQAGSGPIGSLQSGAGWVVAAALFGFGIYSAVSTEKVVVTTLEQYCSLKDRRSSNVQYDNNAIKGDLAKLLHNTIVDQFKASLTDEEGSPDDRVVSEFVRLKMVGAWTDGDHLHVANQIIAVPDVDEDVAFKSWRKEWEEFVNPKNKNGDQCLPESIGDLFDDVVLHGPNNRTIAIKPAH